MLNFEWEFEHVKTKNVGADIPQTWTWRTFQVEAGAPSLTRDSRTFSGLKWREIVGKAEKSDGNIYLLS
jgi:hypothetical protein